MSWSVRIGADFNARSPATIFGFGAVSALLATH